MNVTDEELRQLFRKGWIQASGWAGRDDLLSDMDSNAYLKLEDEAVGYALSHAAGQEVVGALSRGVPERNQDVAAARRERDEAIEEKEYAELELAYLANEMVYEGNSIGWIASKAKKYGDAPHRAWTALTEAGGKCDGQTELAEAIRQHFAAVATHRKEGE